MDEGIEEKQRQTEFNEAIKSILENKALYEKINKTKKSVGITADFDNNTLYRKYSDSIFMEPVYGMIYYNSQDYYNGACRGEFFASEIVYARKRKFRDVTDLIKNVPEVAEHVNSMKNILELEDCHLSYQGKFGGFCKSDSVETLYFEGLDHKKEWGKGEFVVGRPLSRKNCEKLIKEKEIRKRGLDEWIGPTNDLCRSDNIGGLLSNLFDYYNGRDILRILEKNLNRKRVESGLGSRINTGGIETTRITNVKHLGIGLIEKLQEHDEYYEGGVVIYTPKEKFSIPSYDFIDENPIKCFAEALYTKRLYLTNVKMPRSFSKRDDEIFCISGDIYEENE